MRRVSLETQYCKGWKKHWGERSSSHGTHVVNSRKLPFDILSIVSKNIYWINIYTSDLFVKLVEREEVKEKRG